MPSPPPSYRSSLGFVVVELLLGGRACGGDCTRRRCPRRPHAYIAILPPATSTAWRMSIKSASEPMGWYIY
ncbi:hypothetical protein QYE76_003098 [Lolium multiflorum]|uniref:Secreted protein n=1 Tax=Lolium multiflorum TaxID=4521 RepID=A0AAD8RN23_LOLMU|nr:hypothetical protein QYE76_003098 [Lolium multiflorum]